MAAIESGPEHGHPVDQLQLAGRGDSRVEVLETTVRRQRDERQDRADGEKGEPRPQHTNERRRRERAECDGAHGQAPEEAQRATERMVGDRALKQREAGDVLDAVGDPDHPEQHQCHRQVGAGSD